LSRALARRARVAATRATRAVGPTRATPGATLGRAREVATRGDDGDGRNGDGDGDEGARRRFSARRIVKGIARDALCDAVADVDSYAAFVPFCAGARRTPRERWGREREREALARGEEYFEADLEIGFKLFNEKYTSAVTCARPERVTATSVSSGLFRSMTTTWKFSPLDDDEDEDPVTGLPAEGVIVDFEIDFEVKDPMHAAAVSVVFDDVARSQIQAFEKRCRQLALRGGLERDGD
jgi:coenzyme Q-binding protein COQ10